MRNWLITLLAALVLSACASSEFNRTPSAAARAPYDGPVEVLWNYPGAGTYEHLGIVSVTGRTLSDEPELIEIMSEMAAEYGANAIVVQGKPVEVRTMRGTQTKMAATAIWRQ